MIEMLRILPLLISLYSSSALAIDIVGDWQIVGWSDSGAHHEISILSFDGNGGLRTTTATPGKPEIVEYSNYEISDDTLVVTNSRGETSKCPLIFEGRRIKVLVQFGYFVIERSPFPAKERAPHK